jgi:hypothetical protein
LYRYSEGLAPMAADLIAKCGAGAGDLILFGVGEEATVGICTLNQVDP